MIAQIFIAVFGVAAVWLSQDTRRSVQRWASVFGLASQPFWYCAAIETQQWGILFLSVVYTVAWCKGFYTFWFFDEEYPKECCIEYADEQIKDFTKEMDYYGG